MDNNINNNTRTTITTWIGVIMGLVLLDMFVLSEWRDHERRRRQHK